MAATTDEQLSVRTDDGVTLSVQQSGEGPAAIVLLHGLTATRRYVVMGSRLLERSGLRVIAYDARGHGRSSPAPDHAAYGYQRLASDLEAVLDALDVPSAILAGASMGAHTAVCLALRSPERVTALGIVTPAFDPGAASDLDADPETASDLDAARAEPEPSGANAGGERDPLARGLREGGVEGFVAAYDFSNVPEAWRETVEKVIRQRLAAHEHPEAVADALEVVPRSRPFEALDQLADIRVPSLVVASRDEVDPSHPLALAERYARLIPGAELKVEEGGPPVRSPIAWQGGQLSKLLLELSTRNT